jgi:hypothetical protein
VRSSERTCRKLPALVRQRRYRGYLVVLASTIDVGPIDPVLVYALGWLCLGGGWRLARGYEVATKDRQDEQRRIDELGRVGCRSERDGTTVVQIMEAAHAAPSGTLSGPASVRGLDHRGP